MEITSELIDRLSHLCKLEFTESQKLEMKGDLTRILEFCEKLNAIDTDGVEPLIYMCETNNVLRDDKIEGMISKEEALKNAPLHDGDYIKVPRFIEK